MLITLAIFSTNTKDKVRDYQLAGTICGNIKKFKNYKKSTIKNQLSFVAKNFIIQYAMLKEAMKLALRNDYVNIIVNINIHK